MNVLEFIEKIEKLKRRINAIESIVVRAELDIDKRSDARILREIQTEYKKQLEEYEDILRKTPVTVIRGKGE